MEEDSPVSGPSSAFWEALNYSNNCNRVSGQAADLQYISGKRECHNFPSRLLHCKKIWPGTSQALERVRERHCKRVTSQSEENTPAIQTHQILMHSMNHSCCNFADHKCLCMSAGARSHNTLCGYVRLAYYQCVDFVAT